MPGPVGYSVSIVLLLVPDRKILYPETYTRLSEVIVFSVENPGMKGNVLKDELRGID
jgi:hypothetical protein